jgi:hypothetical protein
MTSVIKAPATTITAAASPPGATTSTAPLHPSDYVRFISSEGHEFLLHSACTKASRLLNLHLSLSPDQQLQHNVAQQHPNVAVLNGTVGRAGMSSTLNSTLGGGASSLSRGGGNGQGQHEIVLNMYDDTAVPSQEQVEAMQQAQPFQLPPETKWEQYLSNPNIPDAEKQEAIRSVTLHPLISHSYSGPPTVSIRFPFTPAHILEIVVQYLHFHYRYEREPEGRPELRIPPQYAMQVMKVATVLQC